MVPGVARSNDRALAVQSVLVLAIELRKAGLDRLKPKERSVIVVEEARAERELVQPSGRRLRAVEMNFLLLLRQEVGIALQFERRCGRRQAADSRATPGATSRRAAMSVIHAGGGRRLAPVGRASQR